MPRTRTNRPAGTAASDVDAAGAVAGNAGTTADAAGAGATSETGLDINENEATTAAVVRGLETSQDLASSLKSVLSGHMQLGLLAVSNAVSLANRVNNDAATCSNIVNQSAE